MKESLLWKRINNRFREKIKSRINSESGSALVLAVYFMFAVVAVTSVVAAVLVSLAAPLKNNTKRSEAAYAAEAGLQAGLTYLRQLESDSSLELFPTAVADAGNSNYYKSKVDNTGASGAEIDVVKVKTSQPSYTAQTASSYTDDFKYETEIEFFKNDPNGTEPLQLATERKDAKYAVVVSRAYYADGKNESETRSMSGTYMFGAKATPGSGGGKQGSAFDVATSYKRMDQQPLWPAFLPEAKSSLTVDTKTGAISGTVNLRSNDNGRKSDQDPQFYTDLERTMHPGNSTCIIASSYGDVNKASGISSIEDFFDTSIAPSDGSAVFILPNAYKKTSDNDWTFNPLCQSGQYEKFNSFSYNEDGTITLAGTDLCISGYLGKDIPSHEGHLARLKKCLTSKEEKLENMQVWAFSGVFVNAQFGFNEGGKIRLAKDGEAVDLNQKSYFQDLEGTGKLSGNNLESYVNGNSEPVAEQHGGGGTINSVTSDKYSMLTVHGWSKELHGTILEQDSDSEEIATTLGSGGPAGNKTDRIVNAETGMCLHNQNGTMVVKNCNVNIGPLYPYCWKYIIAKGNREEANVGKKTDYCPSGYQIVDPNGSNKYFKNNEPPTDTFKYTEVASGNSGSISISDGYGNDPFNWGSVTRENGVNNQYTIKKNGQCLAVIKPGYYYDSERTSRARAYKYMNKDFLNNRNYADWISCDAKLYDYYGREVKNAMNWNAPISNGGGSGGGGTDPVEGSSGYQLTKEIAIGTKWNV